MVKSLTIDCADQFQRHFALEDGWKHYDQTLVKKAFGKGSQIGLQSWSTEQGKMGTIVANHVSGVDYEECRE